MQNFVGKGFHLVIREADGSFKVHTIEIMQKTDDSCPVKDIAVGDYFLHLVAANQQGNQANIVCNWTDDLLKNLLANYKEAKHAQTNQITMIRNPLTDDANQWLLTWGTDIEQPKKHPIGYIS